MLAGSVTGGIPGSGVDRSAIGLSTCHVAGGDDTRRTGEERTVARSGGRVDAEWRLSEVGRKTTANTATTAVTVRNTPPSQARRRVRRSASQPILSIPILPSGLNKVRLLPRPRAARSALVPAQCRHRNCPISGVSSQGSKILAFCGHAPCPSRKAVRISLPAPSGRWVLGPADAGLRVLADAGLRVLAGDGEILGVDVGGSQPRIHLGAAAAHPDGVSGAEGEHGGD